MPSDVYNLANYTYTVPSAFIAQEPVSPRDTSRLLMVDRKKGILKKSIFKNILDFFERDDVLVLNDTEVIRARLWGRIQSGSKLEVLLLREKEAGLWEVLIKPGKRGRINTEVVFGNDRFRARIVEKSESGSRIMRFSPANIEPFLAEVGQVPLPPYIKKELQEARLYQTVYAQRKGAVAAPTAGLHFTEALLSELTRKGITILYVTLHCGWATFRPVKTEDIRSHPIESEYFELSTEAVQIINQAKKDGRRIVAVGTTTVRTLESASFLQDKKTALVRAAAGETRLYIVPGYQFKIVDALITNFHTPCSSNLILVASFSGLELTRRAYTCAINDNFRFFSFGDAMLIY